MPGHSARSSVNTALYAYSESQRRSLSPMEAAQTRSLKDSPDFQRLLNLSDRELPQTEYVVRALGELGRSQAHLAELNGHAITEQTWASWEDATASSTAKDFRKDWPTGDGTDYTPRGLRSQMIRAGILYSSRPKERPLAIMKPGSVVPTVQNLVQFIRAMYSAREELEIRCARAAVPKQTLQQFVKAWVDKASLQTGAHPQTILKNVEAGLKVHHNVHEVALFSALLHGIVGDDMRHVCRHLSRRIKHLALKAGEQFPPNTTNNHMTHQDEWWGILCELYNDHDANVVKGRCLTKMASYAPARRRHGPISIPNPDAHPGFIFYDDLVEVCLSFQLEVQIRYLKKFVKLFRLHDSNADGLLSAAEFSRLGCVLRPEMSEEVMQAYTDMVDPCGMDQVTLSDTINCLHKELKEWLFRSSLADFAGDEKMQSLFGILTKGENEAVVLGVQCVHLCAVMEQELSGKVANEVLQEEIGRREVQANVLSRRFHAQQNDLIARNTLLLKEVLRLADEVSQRNVRIDSLRGKRLPHCDTILPSVSSPPLPPSITVPASVLEPCGAIDIPLPTSPVLIEQPELENSVVEEVEVCEEEKEGNSGSGLSARKQNVVNRFASKLIKAELVSSRERDKLGDEIRDLRQKNADLRTELAAAKVEANPRRNRSPKINSQRNRNRLGVKGDAPDPIKARLIREQNLCEKERALMTHHDFVSQTTNCSSDLQSEREKMRQRMVVLKIKAASLTDELASKNIKIQRLHAEVLRQKLTKGIHKNEPTQQNAKQPPPPEAVSPTLDFEPSVWADPGVESKIAEFELVKTEYEKRIFSLSKTVAELTAAAEAVPKVKLEEEVIEGRNLAAMQTVITEYEEENAKLNRQLVSLHAVYQQQQSKSAAKVAELIKISDGMQARCASAETRLHSASATAKRLDQENHTLLVKISKFKQKNAAIERRFDVPFTVPSISQKGERCKRIIAEMEAHHQLTEDMQHEINDLHALLRERDDVVHHHRTDTQNDHVSLSDRGTQTTDYCDVYMSECTGLPRSRQHSVQSTVGGATTSAPRSRHASFTATYTPPGRTASLLETGALLPGTTPPESPCASRAGSRRASSIDSLHAVFDIPSEAPSETKPPRKYVRKSVINLDSFLEVAGNASVSRLLGGSKIGPQGSILRGASIISPGFDPEKEKEKDRDKEGKFGEKRKPSHRPPLAQHTPPRTPLSEKDGTTVAAPISLLAPVLLYHTETTLVNPISGIGGDVVHIPTPLAEVAAPSAILGDAMGSDGVGKMHSSESPQRGESVEESPPPPPPPAPPSVHSSSQTDIVEEKGESVKLPIVDVKCNRCGTTTVYDVEQNKAVKKKVRAQRREEEVRSDSPGVWHLEGGGVEGSTAHFCGLPPAATQMTEQDLLGLLFRHRATPSPTPPSERPVYPTRYARGELKGPRSGDVPVERLLASPTPCKQYSTNVPPTLGAKVQLAQYTVQQADRDDVFRALLALGIVPSAPHVSVPDAAQVNHDASIKLKQQTMPLVLE